MSISLSVQEKKLKIDFKHGGHLGFPILTILANFDVQVTQCFLPSFKSTGLSEQNIDYQDGGHGCHLGFLIGTILAFFDLQVTLMLCFLPSFKSVVLSVKQKRQT